MLHLINSFEGIYRNPWFWVMLLGCVTHLVYFFLAGRTRFKGSDSVCVPGIIGTVFYGLVLVAILCGISSENDTDRQWMFFVYWCVLTATVWVVSYAVGHRLHLLYVEDENNDQSGIMRIVVTCLSCVPFFVGVEILTRYIVRTTI